MFSKTTRVALGGLCAASAAIALAQAGPKAVSAPATEAVRDQPTAEKSGKPFAPPGTKGSPIIGEIFHAQVLLDAAGFSPGVIDGKKGASLTQAITGFQESRGLEVTGALDGPTRQALLQGAKPSTVRVTLGPDDVKSTYIYPLPKDPEKQYKLPFLGYRNMLEKVAERYHTTPATVVALNGPQALIGPRQVLVLPNVIPTSRDYSGVPGKGGSVMNLLNVDGRQPQGKSILVDKSSGVLKVLDDSDRLVAQFPVTMGSTHDPLPVGDWKVTTYAFLPPFHYQPNLFWDAKETATEHMLPAGPNGPVGVAWLDLTKEHYGIHGTPNPETIGRAESHGCIRMTNWDVMRLARMMKPGFVAKFEE